MEIPHICRYCGGIVRLVPAESVYGDSAVRLGLKGEKLYQCQNCNARVGCHRGTIRPLGDLANEVLRLKRIETHQVFDAYWTERGMSRTQAYRWLAKKMHLPERKAHIGGFEMHQCQKLIDLCRGNNETKEDVNPKSGSKALLKLRGELLQLYKRQQELCAAAQSDSEKGMVNKLLNDLETISMAAHNAVNFTYIPLEQMAALQ